MDSQQDLLLLCYILAWIAVGMILLRTLYKQVHMSIIVVRFAGYKKTAMFSELSVVLLWPIGWFITIPILYLVSRRLGERQQGKEKH